MIAYGRQFRSRQLARAISIVGSAASPLLLKALRNGPQAAFEFSARAVEMCNELTEEDVIPAVTLSELAGGRTSGEIWIDLGAPSGEMPPGELASLCSLARHPQAAPCGGNRNGPRLDHTASRAEHAQRLPNLHRRPAAYERLRCGSFQRPAPGPSGRQGCA